MTTSEKIALVTGVLDVPIGNFTHLGRTLPW